MTYTNIPKKKKAYLGKDGNIFGLGKSSLDTSAANYYVGSGIIDANGVLLVTGTMIDYDSIAFANYSQDASFNGTEPIGVYAGNGVLRIVGDVGTNVNFLIIKVV